MKLDELNIGFDILYNNVSSNQAPGLSKYEKSFFLTLAQDQILESYFNPIKNKIQSGYDDSTERDIDFSTLSDVKEYSFEDYTPNVNVTTSLIPDAATTNWHKVVKVNLEMLAIINEILEVNRGSEKTPRYLLCSPITAADYSTLLSRAYRFPKKREAWRIINSYNNERYFELIAGFNDNIVKYIIKYIRKPYPIILENLTGGLTLNNKTEAKELEVDPILHKDILLRAVELAKAAYAAGTFLDLVTSGVTSATLFGILTKGGNE